MASNTDPHGLERGNGELPKLIYRGPDGHLHWGSGSELDSELPLRAQDQIRHLRRRRFAPPSPELEPELESRPPPTTAPTMASNPPPHPDPPSVEAAYRRKCIEMKRRLNEVEAANDRMRVRRARIVRGIRKMRMERAIMLDHLAKMMESTGRARDIGPVFVRNSYNGDREAYVAGAMEEANAQAEYYVDDESEGSDAEAPPMIPKSKPQERPLRTKRSHNTMPTTTTNNNNPISTTPSTSTGNRRSSLPQLLPATNAPSHSPTAPPQQEQLTSSFRVVNPSNNTTSGGFATVNTPTTTSHASQQISPNYNTTSPVTNRSPGPATTTTSHVGPPERPLPPFDDFYATNSEAMSEAQPMRPSELTRAVADAWRELGHEGQRPWNERYNERMREYQIAMDEYKRNKREQERNGNGGDRVVDDGRGLADQGHFAGTR